MIVQRGHDRSARLGAHVFADALPGVVAPVLHDASHQKAGSALSSKTSIQPALNMTLVSITWKCTIAQHCDMTWSASAKDTLQLPDTVVLTYQDHAG